MIVQSWSSGYVGPRVGERRHFFLLSFLVSGCIISFVDFL